MNHNDMVTVIIIIDGVSFTENIAKSSNMIWLMDPFCRRHHHRRHCSRRCHRHHSANALTPNTFGHIVFINIIFKLTGNPRMLDILLNEKGKIGKDQ